MTILLLALLIGIPLIITFAVCVSWIVRIRTRAESRLERNSLIYQLTLLGIGIYSLMTLSSEEDIATIVLVCPALNLLSIIGLVVQIWRQGRRDGPEANM